MSKAQKAKAAKTVERPASNTEFYSALMRLSDAGACVTQIRTREPLRAALILRARFLRDEEASVYHEWDITNGIRRFSLDNYNDHTIEGNPETQEFVAALASIMANLRRVDSDIIADSPDADTGEPGKIHHFAFINPQPFIVKENPMALEYIQQFAAILPTRNVRLHFVTPDDSLPLPTGTVLTTDLRTPSPGELRSKLDEVLDANSEQDLALVEEDSFSDEECDSICSLAAGMTVYEFETHLALSIVEASRDNVAVNPARVKKSIAEGKTEVVKQSDILELFPTEDLSNVGGMQRLKHWLEERRTAFSPEAAEFGVEKPRGIFIAGVPGTGKSLVAKAIASMFNVPLLRLDFGKVFSKYIGESEQRMRAALRMVEDMGPLVLFADEIDKGLGGVGSGGDSGASSRVMGSFLTWMQDSNKHAFVVMTANRVDGLPPELTRKGRMDQVFSTGLPSAIERREVLAVHLRRRGRDINELNAAAISSFVSKSERFVQAEIEQVVKDALILAFNDLSAEDLTGEHLLTALDAIKPMANTHREQIDALLAWASNNAVSVSYTDEEMRRIKPMPQQSSARLVRSRRKSALH